MISLLHPTRQRPFKSRVTTQKWIDYAAAKDFELIISIDDNDPYKEEYLHIYSNHPFITRVISNPNRSAIEAINNAAKEAKGDILIVVSDDTDCIEDWDEVILKAVEGHKDYLLKVYDGVQKYICTMPIMDRMYYERYGYIYNPIYTHQFCDTELSHVADVTGRIIWRNDIEIRHLHYSVTKEKRDSLYTRNDNTWADGKVLYLKRFMEKFGLPEEYNVWNVSSQGHKDWLKAAMRIA